MADQLHRARAPAQELPTRLELVEMARHLHDLALEATYDRDGETFNRPDLHSAAKAIELIGKLCGHLGDGRTMDKATLERELDRMGYRLEAKMKRVG